MKVTVNPLNKTTSSLSANTLENPNKKSSLLKKCVVGTTCCTLALSTLAYLVYQNFYSTSRLNHNADESPLRSLYTRHVTSCDDNSFKAFQIFYNTLESPLYYLGLHSVNNPPGDLTAFILDQNFEGAECSYSSYSPTQITKKMKNTLLGEVMRRQALLDKDFSSTIQWLVERGADPSYSHPVKKSELQKDHAFSYTPLLSAFESQNTTLFNYLLTQGANPDARLYSYSKEYQNWDARKPIIQEIVERILDQKNISDAHCKSYKTIIDLSIAHHKAGIHSFDSLSNQDLEALIYSAIREQTSCSKHFPLKEEHKRQEQTKKSTKSADQNSQSWSDFINDGINKAKVLFATFQKIFNEYFPDVPPEEVDDVCKFLGLDRATLAEMSKADAISTIKTACRGLKRDNHPDKGGDEQIFIKVVASCEKILAEYKGQ